MNYIYLFDIDGTLTESRQKMTDDFAEKFLSIMKDVEYYFVTGSDLPKVEEQVHHLVRCHSAGIFTCLGNEYWETVRKSQPDGSYLQVRYEKRYSHIVNFTPELIKYLEEYVKESRYPDRFGNHIEIRDDCLLNFSICGRDIPHERRHEYMKWDEDNRERPHIIENLQMNFPDYEFSAGGQISIDISRKGQNKSQVLAHFRLAKRGEPIVFFGDKLYYGGNDLPLGEQLLKENDHRLRRNYAVQVKDPAETLNKLITDRSWFV